MSLRRFYEEVDSQELSLWLAFYAIEGFPEIRADYRAAYTSWTVASCHSCRTKLKDYVPNFDPENSQKEKWREAMAHFAALAKNQEKNGIDDNSKGIPSPRTGRNRTQ